MNPATHHRPHPPRAGFTGVVEFDDFDAIRGVAPDWDLSHLQIGRGRSRARLSVAQTERALLAVVHRSPGILERGTPPPGTVTFTIGLRGSRFLAQRVPWGQDRMAVVPQGVGYEFLSTGPSTLFTLCVSQERLDDVAVEQCGERLSVSGAGPTLRFRDEASRSTLIGIWSGALAAARRNPELLSDTVSATRMEEEVLRAVLESAVPEGQQPRPRPYRELALRVESYIRRSLEEQIKLEDICAATHASARSVHASFKTIFGVPPKAYWKALRLTMAREELRRARKGTTVSEVAAKWSFYRFGYFAVDYRETFGENPSDTLRRALGRGAARGSAGHGHNAVAG